eukprot:scaffold2799_cov117-Skeletonema_dohrnii-CCMP3373.AAC.13
MALQEDVHRWRVKQPGWMRVIRGEGRAPLSLSPQQIRRLDGGCDLQARVYFPAGVPAQI